MLIMFNHTIMCQPSAKVYVITLKSQNRPWYAFSESGIALIRCKESVSILLKYLSNFNEKRYINIFHLLLLKTLKLKLLGWYHTVITSRYHQPILIAQEVALINRRRLHRRISGSGHRGRPPLGYVEVCSSYIFNE